MAKAKTTVNAVFERIIATVKKTCEYVDDGYRVKFSTFASAFSKDEVMRNNDELKRITIDSNNIFDYCSQQKEASVQIIHDWLYIRPILPVTSAKIKDDCRIIIENVRKQYSKDKNGKTLIPISALEKELSNKIIFYEYYLRKNNLAPMEFIKSIVKVVPNPNAGQVKKEEKKPAGVGMKPQTAEGNHSGDESGGNSGVYQNAIDKMSESVLSKAIADAINKYGDLYNGVCKISMGKLCVKLHQDSPAFTSFCLKYKGTTRDFLISRFGYMLLIETVKGVEWVSLSQAKEKKEKKKIVNDGQTGIQNNMLVEKPAVRKNDPEDNSILHDSGLTLEEADEKVRQDILRIMEQHGEKRKGISRMVLGDLCNELLESSEAYSVARRLSGKAPARIYLLEHFGKMLSIEFIDGKDWVRLDNPSYQLPKTQQAGSNESKDSPGKTDDGHSLSHGSASKSISISVQVPDTLLVPMDAVTKLSMVGMHQGADFLSAITGRINKKGTKVTITGKQKDDNDTVWYLVERDNGEKGYVREDYLVISDKEPKEAKGQKEKSTPVVPEVNDVVQPSESAARQNTESQNMESPVDELASLSDEELVKLHLLMQFVFGIWGGNIKITEIKKLIKKNHKKQEPDGLEEIADRVGADALDLLIKNETAKNLLSGRTVDLLVGILNNELKARNINHDALSQSMTINMMKAKETADPGLTDQTVMTEEDYRELDEWLPF